MSDPDGTCSLCHSLSRCGTWCDGETTGLREYAPLPLHIHLCPDHRRMSTVWILSVRSESHRFLRRRQFHWFIESVHTTKDSADLRTTALSSVYKQIRVESKEVLR